MGPPGAGEFARSLSPTLRLFSTLLTLLNHRTESLLDTEYDDVHQAAQAAGIVPSMHDADLCLHAPQSLPQPAAARPLWGRSTSLGGREADVQHSARSLPGEGFLYEPLLARRSLEAGRDAASPPVGGSRGEPETKHGF